MPSSFTKLVGSYQSKIFVIKLFLSNSFNCFRRYAKYRRHVKVCRIHISFACILLNSWINY